jgi:hypothetical protein
MENVFHKIKANLYPNLLTEDPNDFSARVISERSLNVKQICSEAVGRGGAPTTAAAMEHNVNLFLKEMAYQLCNGFSVNTGYFTACPLIKGVFNSQNESFDPVKHALLFQMNQGELLRKEIGSTQVEISGPGDSSIMIDQVINVKTGSVNDLLTPGKSLRIYGFKIKVAGNHPDNGVYFINQATNERTKVPNDEFITNNPSEVVVEIPALPAGTYKLEITSQFSSSAVLLNDPRSFILDKVLTVA